MFRLMLLALLLAPTPLFAFFATPNGFEVTEYALPSSAGGITWDPAVGGVDFYANHNGGIRRFNVGGGAFSGTPLFTAPATIAPATYAFFDSLAIDPTSTNDFYVSYSGNFSRLYKLTRTGPDVSLTAASVDYSANGEFIYQLLFIPDLPTIPVALRGQLLAAGAVGFSGVAKIYRVNKATLALTELIDVGTGNGSGNITVDAAGNIYSVVPTPFGVNTGSEIRRFAAAGVVTALGGTPLTTYTTIVDVAADVWNISSLSARQEGGSTFLYFGTQEHASIHRLCVDTGDMREFMQGFGGVSDGFTHFAQGGNIGFSSSADTFRPAGGGNATLVVPFNVFTPSFQQYSFLYLVTPEPVNVAVASFVMIQQPTTVNSGVRFSIEVEARNSGGTAILANVGVVATATGAGTLRGFNIVSRPGDALVIDDLVYTGAAASTFTLTVTLCGGAINVTTATITVATAATAIAVSAPPTDVTETDFFAVGVELRDAGGIRVMAGSDAAREVTVVKQSGPGNLFGTTTVTANSGQATFSALLIDMPGNYVLRFESEGLTTATLNVQVGTTPADKATDSGSCTTTGAASPLLALVLLLIAGAALRRRVAKG